MTPDEIYEVLVRSNSSPGCDAFDRHVLACIFAVAAGEAKCGGSMVDALGVSEKTIRRTCERYFPRALAVVESFGLHGDPVVDEDEQCVRQLLGRSHTVAGPLGSLLASLIARRAMRPNHLWQDLGLRHRGELSRLMMRHFAPLALRNHQDMKWKKFFYRMICRDEGYSLCSAPSCSECCDFQNCFGDEDGESLLARTRFYIETQAPIVIEAAHGQ